MTLRDYQTQAVADLRQALKGTHEVTYLAPGEDEPYAGLYLPNRSVCLQLATGAGKTPIVGEIVRSSQVIAGKRGQKFRVWFVVPRNELLQQGSDHLTRAKVPHGLIAAGVEESRAFLVHVVSKDTLLRRLERIKDWPSLIIFDEAHIALDAQLRIRDAAPLATKIIGVTATPERLDGRGLSEVYDAVVYGPSIPWLTERGFLSPLRYFAPPIEGLDQVHRKGTEFDADELEALFEKRKVYGSVVEYYQKYGKRSDGTNKSALIFCRSVKSAYDVAERFRAAGFRFECVEGNMGAAERRAMIGGLRDGTLDGLTNADLCTYGLDVPRVEYGASIRPTLSRSLYFQMVGRILRPYPGKSEALFFDHANLVQEHTDPRAPGVPLFYLDGLEWNFHGREKRERTAAAPVMRQCPYMDFEYCRKPECSPSCKLRPDGAPDPRREALPEVDATLEERKAPTSWTELQPEERREVQDRIAHAADEAVAALALGRIEPGPIGELLKVAEELGRSKMWVYHYLTEKLGSRAVCVPLVHEICRQSVTKDGKPYKSSWAYMKIKELRQGIKEGAA